MSDGHASSLVNAFKKLLARKDFEAISVQDIAEKATVNRATFPAQGCV